MRIFIRVLVHIFLATSTTLFGDLLLDPIYLLDPADSNEEVTMLPLRSFHDLSNENFPSIHFSVSVFENAGQSYPISGYDNPLRINGTQTLDKAGTPNTNDLESALLNFSTFATQPKLYGIIGACVLLGLIISKRIWANRLSH